MQYLQIITEFSANANDVIEGFTEKLFIALKPPLIPMELQRFDGCASGDEVHLVLGVVPLKQRWVSIITESEQKENYFRFVDKGAVLPFPFATWEHEHIVLQLPNGKVRIEDNIRYTTAPIIFEKMLYPLLLLQFGYRKKAYPRFFSRKAIK